MKVTLQELLDEIDQNPLYDFEIDRYIYPLFSRLLVEHGFQLHIIKTSPETVRCRILKTPEKEVLDEDHLP